MTVQVIHKNSSVQNRAVLGSQLANGELAINYHESGPFVQLKDTDGDVIRVGGVIQQETQPGLGQKGAFWFKGSTKILYLHNGTTWIAVGGVSGGGGGSVTNTSQLINDGQDGVNPFITAQNLTPPGDGELTIRQGGVSKGTFKANQSGDTVIDIDAGGTGGVTKILAGTNVTITPNSGVGDVTINATGGGGGGATNLGYTAATDKGTVTSDTGTDAVIPVVDGTKAGLMTPAQNTKLDDAITDAYVGQALLTIKQGGSTKGTFSANASTPVTVELDAGAAQVQSDYAQTDTSAVDFIKNKPTIPPGQVNSDWNASSGVAEILNKPDLSLKADLVGGKVPTSQIPAIAISTFLGSVASEAAMLALVGETGDYCIRTDTSSTWVISGPDGSSIGNWTELLTPASPVESVNGKTGVVVLGFADVGAASTAQGAKADSALQPSDNISELTNDAGYITSSDIPAQTQSDWTETDTAKPAFIKNKPSIPTAQDLQSVCDEGTVTTTKIQAAGFRVDLLTAITASSPG